VQWIALLLGAATLLGLSNRIFGGSTRMTLVVVVAAALLGLLLTLK
jgi:hypothetical protein